MSPIRAASFARTTAACVGALYARAKKALSEYSRPGEKRSAGILLKASHLLRGYLRRIWWQLENGESMHGARGPPRRKSTANQLGRGLAQRDPAALSVFLDQRENVVVEIDGGPHNLMMPHVICDVKQDNTHQ